MGILRRSIRREPVAWRAAAVAVVVVIADVLGLDLDAEATVGVVVAVLGGAFWALSKVTPVDA